MKPYGRTKNIKQNLVDNHPPKGYINWWEDEMDSVSKKTERQIKHEVDERGR